jgi:integrase
MTGQPTFPTLLEGFFTRRLMQQRQASVHTVASYRDTFRLLLQFAQRRLRKAPSTLAIEDIDVSLVGDFLDELEKVRHVTARTRNLRLTAIHSFFRYVAFEAPAHAAQTQRVLAIPAKRFTRALVPFLSRQEVDALLAAPDRRTRSGRRDHALILLAVQAGLRLSELTGLRPQDLHLGTGTHVRAEAQASESIETTQVYLDADLELKQQVLDAVTPLNGKPGRYRPDDKLLALLKGLSQRRLCPVRLPARIARKADHGATGHSPARDIINSMARWP